MKLDQLKAAIGDAIAIKLRNNFDCKGTLKAVDDDGTLTIRTADGDLYLDTSARLTPDGKPIPGEMILFWVNLGTVKLVTPGTVVPGLKH